LKDPSFFWQRALVDIRKYEGKKPHGRTISRRGVYSKINV
jgi:hypothetical protein